MYVTQTLVIIEEEALPNEPNYAVKNKLSEGEDNSEGCRQWMY